MTFTPANISSHCQLYPSLPTCQPSMLAFVAFLVQNFGHSYDSTFTDSRAKECDDHQESYDFVIVGAGTAGCVVANRLSEIRGWKILLLEAGGEEPSIADVPAFSKLLRGSSLDYDYRTEPEPVAFAGSAGRRASLIRGRMMGGSSSLNTMAYVRGNRADYDEWARLGNAGWSYDEVMPYFLKSEGNRDVDAKSEYHSTSGYLTVQKFPYEDANGRALVDAWRELGFRELDYNGREQLGVSRYQTTSINGARQSSNGAFVRPIRGRRRSLVVKTHARATRLLLDGKSVVGVEYSANGDRVNVRVAYARKEVVLSAGAFDSPKLLMLSGIGPKKELEKAGIDVVADLPVGDNLQDHPAMPAFVGLFANASSTLASADEMQNDAVYWLSTREGPLSSITGPQSTVTFSQTLYEPEVGVPDVQYQYFNAIRENIDTTGKYVSPDYQPYAYYDAFVMAPTLLNPKSRGTVRLNASDPVWSPPVIRLNLLADPRDVRSLVNAAMMGKKLFRTRAFHRRGIKKREASAEGCERFKFESPRYFECVAKAHTMLGLHFAGSCAMGRVVDARLRVKGVRGLRVVDASVMPALPRANTYAPTVMIGEKASDMIKEDWAG